VEPLTGQSLYAIVQRTWPNPDATDWQDLDQCTRDEYEIAAQMISEQRYLQEKGQTTWKRRHQSK
jgi:hypothetical protein